MKTNRHALPFLGIAVLVLASSCAPAPKALVVAPSAPPPAAPVAPVADAVRADAAATNAVASRLESQVAGLQRSTLTLRDGMAKALSEADRLRTAKAASEAELDSLWRMLTDSNEKVRNLFTEAEAARASADEQRDLRAKAEQNLMNLARVASLRDAENTTLRTQNDDFRTALQAAATREAAQEDKLRVAERNAALGSWFKTMGWVVLIAAILIVAAKIFLRPYP